MGAKSSLVILNEFLAEHKIKTDPKKHLKKFIVDSKRTIKLRDDIVARIITDAYDIAGEKVREIDTLLQKKIEFYLGRVQKEQLKKYLAYSDPDALEQLISLTGDETGNFAVKGKKICKQNALSQEEITDAVTEFLSKLNQAIKEKNHERVQDYLIFIYSRLLAKNENRTLSLKQLFDNNAQKYQLNKSQHKSLEGFCKSERQEKRFDVINKYNSKYIDILEQDEKNQDKSSAIYLNVTPKLYNQFKTKEEFYNALFSFIKTAYDKIKNHRVLVVKVQNIIVNDINIKWEIYSYLSIFAEKFHKREEKQQYYFPEILCKEFLEYRYKKEITSEDVEDLKQYYKGKIKFQQLKQKLNEISKSEIDEFKHIYTGFTFIDCSILLSKKPLENSKELSFMQNKTELLLLFSKHEIDPRKIPCPVCSSLIISGNSFPELGIRSWECKNPLCSERSKTNRGKRYSARTIFMQNSRFDFSKENTIEKSLIEKWRKDVVTKHSPKSLYTMITKYFSLVGDNITIIDAASPKQFEKIAKNEKRCVKSFNFKKFVGDIDHNLYRKFFEKPSDFQFIEHFLYEESLPKSQKIQVTEFPAIIQGDCKRVLESIGEVHNMVTSPPYYNAREYSQWASLYTYLHEMYLAAQGSFQALQKGGVFFFNIGDIFDNEKIIVKSKMGGKRIPLGAYIVLLFQKAGFELLDNVIWDKGEPQTNRHKNDGNNVPYYQRPANCYEHIFIFKKPGAKLKLNQNKKQLIDSNYQKFIPVYKIGPGGINRYGHTAPFPENVPLLSLQCFTNEGEIVLDPFLGSGTSVIAAAKNKRNGLGIELMDEYVQLSSKRANESGISVEIIDSTTGKSKTAKATQQLLKTF